LQNQLLIIQIQPPQPENLVNTLFARFNFLYNSHMSENLPLPYPYPILEIWVHYGSKCENVNHG